MLLDKSLMFGEALSASQTAGETGAIIGDVIDAAGANKDGYAALAANQGRIIVFVRTAINSAEDDATFELQVRASSEAALTGGTTKVLMSTGAIAEATLVANYKLMDLPLPPMPDGTEFLGLWKIARVHATNAGTMDAYIATETPEIIKTVGTGLT